MSAHPTALPPIVDEDQWRRELESLRAREKAATRELDAIAAQRRRLPMVELPEYVLDGPDGPVRLVDVFEGRSQLITYHHMWSDDSDWQCPGCTGFTAQFTRLEFLENYDARFVVVTQGSIDQALAYREKVGNRMPWYSTSRSSFGADMDAPPGEGSRSTSSCERGIASSARGTPTGGEPNSSPTPSPSSTSSRGAGRRSGRMCRPAGRSSRRTPAERDRSRSPRGTAPRRDTATEARSPTARSFRIGPERVVSRRRPMPSEGDQQGVAVPLGWG